MLLSIRFIFSFPCPLDVIIIPYLSINYNRQSIQFWEKYSMKVCATFLLTKCVGCGIMEIPAMLSVAGALKKPPWGGLILNSIKSERAIHYNYRTIIIEWSKRTIRKIIIFSMPIMRKDNIIISVLLGEMEFIVESKYCARTQVF